MRIDRLDLMAYGHFTNKTINLSEGDFGLHIIYGDNEAGKSTCLRALIAWLFGIRADTDDSFLHSNPQLRIGGKLRLSDGKEVEFIRRKGTKGTILSYGSENPLDDAIIASFLTNGMDKTLFKKLWGIDHNRLIAGGQELLDQSGDLGQALFSAAAGTTGLREILVDLQKGAEEIFKPRAHTKILNQTISNFKSAKKRIKDLSLPVSEWKKLQKELSDINAKIELVEKAIESKRKEKSRLDRLNRVKGALAERRSVLGRIDELGQVLILPEGFEEKRRMANDNLQIAGEKKQRAEAKLLSLREESESLNVRYELLDNEEAILALYKELGAVEKTIKDRPQQDGKRRLLRNEAELLLKGIRPDLDLEKADELRPLLNNKKWILGLAQKHSLLAQKKEKAEATLRDITDEQSSIQKEVGGQPESGLDLKELKAAIASARKAGNIEHRLSDLQKRAFDEKSASENEFARLGRYEGTIETLLKLAMPVSETLDTFEKESDELAEKLRDSRRQQQEIKEEKIQTEHQLKTLLLINTVPTISELKESRDVRNKGWNLIKRKYIERVDIENDILDFAPNAELHTVYEQTVENADHVSDRLRTAADQVAKRTDFETKIATLKIRLGHIAEDIENMNGIQKTLQDRWDAVWKPLGIDAGKPREMKQWILRVEKLVTSVQSANSVARDAQNLAKDYKRLKEAISNHITEFDNAINQHGLSLEAMIKLCEQRVEGEETVRERNRQLEKSLNEAQIRIKRIKDEFKSIDTDQSNWSHGWAQAIKGLGLKMDIHPEYATETLDRLVSFFDKFDKSEELRKRIFGMDQVEETFKKKVFEFADGMKFKTNGQEAPIIVAQLNRDLNIAREARASLKKIETQIKEVKDEIEFANITIRAAKEQLTSLKAQAGVDKAEDLRAAGEKSGNKRELQQNLHTIEKELNRNGDGLSIEELEKEFDGSEIDAIEGKLEKINLEVMALQAKRDDLRDRRQTIQNEITAKDGNAAAANASEEAEEHFAAMVSNTEQYLHLKIAALILEQQIEDYRKKNQAPVLARAGELFSRLTLGSYASLRDELDDKGKPIILGVRPNDDEVTVEGMSDGSRDQLYLSLRLATLEQHLNKGESMPFIVDDILIGFDDNRTRVCLDVLAELSAGTQVLLFTHHRRVIELAEPLDAKSGIYTHELA